MNNTYLVHNSFVHYTSVTDRNLSLNSYSENTGKISGLDKDVTVDSYVMHIKGAEVSCSKEIFLPLSIVKNNSSLESIVLYLKEVSGLTYSQIARMLGRDPRTIWVTYSNAKRKGLKVSASLGDDYYIPTGIFTSRNFSVLESLVFYLKNNHSLTINQISGLLGKNYQTINTVYRRALHKLSAKI